MTVAEFQAQADMKKTKPEMLAVNMCIIGSSLLPRNFHVLCKKNEKKWSKVIKDFHAKTGMHMHPRYLVKWHS